MTAAFTDRFTDLSHTGAAGGDLLCFYTESSAHVYCPGGRAVASRSRDGGRTWDPPQVLVLFNKKDWISHIGYGVLQDSTGRIWVGIRSQLYDEDEGAPNDPRAWKDQNAILFSDDDGHTWTRARARTPDRQLPRPVIEMSDGRLLWTARHVDERGDEIRATCLHRPEKGVLTFEVRPHPELGPIDTGQGSAELACWRPRVHIGPHRRESP